MVRPHTRARVAVQGLLFPIFRELSKDFVPLKGAAITGACPRARGAEAQVTPRPSPPALFLGLVTSLIAFFFPLDALAEAISIGTLMAFTIVDAGMPSRAARGGGGGGGGAIAV